MKKNGRICSLLVASSLVAGTCVTPVAAADIGTEKIYSESSPAFFNGTTSITVPVGTKLDLKDTEYRIFANDFEDGDCTQKIEITSNNYKEEAGNYQVKYKVTDSHKNVSEETVDIHVEDRTDKLIERTLYTLPKISNMDLVGTHRGNNHDRQNIGLYLKAGQKIKVRQTNLKFAKDLKVSLDTDDGQTAKSYTLPKEGGWVTVEAEYDCVPSIMTPKDAESEPVIEIQYDDSVESLVYYRYQDDQEQFFEEWDEKDASYATMETERATLLVPKKDKDKILAAKEVKHSVTLELDVYNNYGQIDEGIADSKHLAFLKSSEVKSAASPAPHHQEKTLPSNFLNTDVSMKLSWDSQLQQLTYEMYPISDEASVIKDTYAFKPEEEMTADEAYLLISAASGQAGTFAFELSSFENGDTQINQFSDLFARPLGNGLNSVEGNRIQFTKEARQLGAVNTKNKIDLGKDFVLSGIVNIADDSDGMAFTLHNDEKGQHAVGSNNGALGVFAQNDDIDYYGFDSIDELLEFYDDFSEEFDEYMGLSYDTEELLNQNVRTKYFVKADKHGAGAAYYGWEHTAQNGDTIDGYLTRNWLPIHEFAHGYEGRLATQELALVDVLNNVLGYYVEQSFKAPGSGGWMGRKQDIEKEIADTRSKLTDYHDYNQMDYRDRLYSLVNLTDRIGSKDAMAALHTLNRKMTKEGIYYNTTDIFAKAFSEYSNKNIVPYLESWKLMPGIAEKANVYEQDFPILYYLRDCVESDEKAVEIMNRLNCDGIYSLVTVDDLREYGLKGNLELSLSIDDFEQLKDKKIRIKNGKEVIEEIEITEKQIMVENLPAGAYEIEIPNTKTTPYLYDYQYVVISNGQTTKKEITYQKEYASVDSDMLVKMMGLGDWIFATLSYDKTAGNIEVITNGGQPHSYYEGKPYTIITVSDGDNVLYNREYIGDAKNENATEKIAVSVGDKVTIWHDEASTRLKGFGVLTNEVESAFAAKDKTAEYIVTEYGLMPADFTEDEMYGLYQRRVEKYAELVDGRLPEAQKDNKNAYPVEKNLLKQSFSLLKEEDRKALEKKYNRLLNGSKPEVTVVQSWFKVGDEVVPESILEATDKEDGTINITDVHLDLKNVPIENGKFTKAGSYEVTYRVADSDENEMTGKFLLVVEGSPEIVTPDKRRLQKLIHLSRKYADNLELYIPRTTEGFQEALIEAEKTAANENASQEEINEASAALLDELTDLKLIPDKKRLEGLREK